MIVTELYNGQGLGNQLWCYCVCRSIADKSNMSFNILGQDNFKAKEFLEVDFGEVSKNNEKYKIFHEQRFYDKEIDYVASSFDDRVLSLDHGTQIEGLFQSEKYFFDNIDRIKEYIKIKEEYKNLITIPDGVCILNIRGGEYKRHKKFNLPKSYWINAMNNMRSDYGVSQFLIVTDDHKYARALFPDIDIIQEGVAESYIALHSASYLIVSNSTFSYFPIKTKSVPPVVIAPKYFARFNDSCNKWASPANIYKKWLWQDRDGEIQTYEECINEANQVEAMYFSGYYIGVPPSLLSSKRVSSMVPDRIKNAVKKSLSILFPLKYG